MINKSSEEMETDLEDEQDGISQFAEEVNSVYQFTHPPIEEHGVIGNMHTCALVSSKGTIDWYCYPDFDSPSIFGSILDSKTGGRFSIFATMDKDNLYTKCQSSNTQKFKQFYHPDTNMLLTRFLSTDGVGEIQDFMPVGKACEHTGQTCKGWIVRRINTIRGVMNYKIVCMPAFNYGRSKHQVKILPGRNAVVFTCDSIGIEQRPSLSMVLECSDDLEWKLTASGSGVWASISIPENSCRSVVFRASWLICSQKGVAKI